jgi:endoglycosylceramidase
LGKNQGENLWRLTSIKQEGKYNETYYEVVRGLVERLGERGIYTLLDMHQDLLSSEFCLYDGVPRWLIEKMEAPKHAFPWPFPKQPICGRPWMENAFTEACQLAFQNIYDNYAGMRDHFAKFWFETANRWANNTNILGYELINEPFAGDCFAHPSFCVPGVAGKENLQPLYNVLQAAIREVDRDTIIFYEPVTWGMLRGKGIFGSGFTSVPGGDAFRNASALS